jgi:hypothetical protein
MTHYMPADLRMADRHIAEGERHIVRREELLSSLRLKERPTFEAEKLLTLLYESQAEHWKHREAIAAALAIY